MLHTTAFVALLLVVTLSNPATAGSSTKRVPAEREPQEAIWLQCPGKWEKAHESAFAKISVVIAEYQKLHIHYSSNKIKEDARRAISRIDGDPDHENIVWHTIAYDSAWMRDNGPVYVIDNGEVRVQNWKFDAWGGAFGDSVTYRLDNEVPPKIGAHLGFPVGDVNIVHERGNLEFKGFDSVILNWSVLGDVRRNLDYTKEKPTADIKRHFGVSKVIFV